MSCLVCMGLASAAFPEPWPRSLCVDRQGAGSTR